MFYAIYVILLKVRIRSESRIDMMQLFFGFVGLFKILAYWPIGVVLHFTGVEKLPTTGRAVAGLLVNVSFHQLTWRVDSMPSLSHLPGVVDGRNCRRQLIAQL